MDYEKARHILETTNKRNFPFKTLEKMCNVFFRESRRNGSHIIYKMPWSGDPRINLQPDTRDPSKAKPYQVENVRKAVDRWFGEC